MSSTAGEIAGISLLIIMIIGLVVLVAGQAEVITTLSAEGMVASWHGNIPIVSAGQSRLTRVVAVGLADWQGSPNVLLSQQRPWPTNPRSRYRLLPPWEWTVTPSVFPIFSPVP